MCIDKYLKQIRISLDAAQIRKLQSIAISYWKLWLIERRMAELKGEQIADLDTWAFTKFRGKQQQDYLIFADKIKQIKSDYL